jgi:prephenate dehydrogenase
VLSEDPDLYASLQMNLKGMDEIHAAFQKNLTAWSEIVRNGDKDGFIRRMESLAAKRMNSAPDFKRAYEKMYRTLGS